MCEFIEFDILQLIYISRFLATIFYLVKHLHSFLHLYLIFVRLLNLIYCS